MFLSTQDDAVQKIYKKHQVKTCTLYQNLTDTKTVHH